MTATQYRAACNPRWDEATRVHDWRNHVPDYIRLCWDEFNEEQRRLLMSWAEELADAEEWE